MLTAACVKILSIQVATNFSEIQVKKEEEEKLKKNLIEPIQLLKLSPSVKVDILKRKSLMIISLMASASSEVYLNFRTGNAGTIWVFNHLALTPLMWWKVAETVINCQEEQDRLTELMSDDGSHL